MLHQREVTSAHAWHCSGGHHLDAEGMSTPFVGDPMRCNLRLRRTPFFRWTTAGVWKCPSGTAVCGHWTVTSEWTAAEVALKIL